MWNNPLAAVGRLLDPCPALKIPGENNEKILQSLCCQVLDNKASDKYMYRYRPATP
ncbi:hypothetical protein KDA_42620 [Dictyobacter alpinus]|uniref:Uncharacterized protein n=1 Tax=Dictyobacter alpinus TaxID=2014873 RepID=A0A402BBH4_9CHLR|nr:hypothetical protein KDA_42620 [Dictyobacter alpinus]